MISPSTIVETIQEAQLFEIKLKAINIATNEFSKDLVYHNIAFINRMVESIQLLSVEEGMNPGQQREMEVIGWLCMLGLADLDQFKSLDGPRSFLNECYRFSALRADEIMVEAGVEFNDRIRIINVIKDVFVLESYEKKEAQILKDGLFSDFARPLAQKYMKKIYRELLLLGVINFSTIKWLMKLNEFLTMHSFATEYGKEHYEPSRIKLIHQLDKEIRNYRRTNETILKREMNISAEELKKLKKTLKKIKGRNERGIQTMFRTTSRNHYTLNQMLDRKANILISVNTIILSVIITKVIAGGPEFKIENLPIIFMMSTALISILFAILAIIPEKTHGEFTEGEIRNKEGNLLFFGNYYNMSFRDYTWGMLQMINDGEHLYMTMITDLYYFGKQLAKKYRMLRLSLFALGIGLTVSTLTLVLLSNL